MCVSRGSPPFAKYLTTHRASVLHALGLGTAAPGTPVPCYAAGAIIYSFLFAHTVLASRGPKIALRIDRNVAPRGDLSKHGEAAVRAGKLSQARLDQLQRLEAAHANTIDHFPLFVGSVVRTPAVVFWLACAHASSSCSPCTRACPRSS